MGEVCTADREARAAVARAAGRSGVHRPAPAAVTLRLWRHYGGAADLDVGERGYLLSEGEPGRCHAADYGRHPTARSP